MPPKTGLAQREKIAQLFKWQRWIEHHRLHRMPFSRKSRRPFLGAWTDKSFAPLKLASRSEKKSPNYLNGGVG